MKVNEAIARLGAFFVVAFLLLAARQVWVQVVAGPAIAMDPHDPRSALLAPYRGEILARDGTVLARSTAHGREYPLGAALAQTLGYVSARYGTSGLEAAYDDRLSPEATSNDPLAQLRAIRTGGPNPITRGANLITTIDPAIQLALYQGLNEYGRAAGVALDPRTGAVLALASVPSFDPARLERDFQTINADEGSPLLNRALQGLYPPGSSFKIVTASNALFDGTVTPQSTFEDPGYLRVGSFVFHDDENESTGYQNLTGAFALSSNVDFGQITLKEGADRWFDGASRWGLGEPIDFDLSVARDHLPQRDEMTPGILAQLGFGQADLLVTPMRMALVGATIAGGGIEPRPFVVKAFRSPDGSDVFAEHQGAARLPISAEVADEVRAMMVAVVQRGTGTAAALPGVTVAGKTGTATLATGRAHAWFVAFAPAEAPRVAVAIVVEHGGYGGVAAAPIAREVLRVALSRLKG